MAISYSPFLHQNKKGLLDQLTSIIYAREDTEVSNSQDKDTLSLDYTRSSLFSLYNIHTCLKSVTGLEGVVRNTMGFYTALVRLY